MNSRIVWLLLFSVFLAGCELQVDFLDSPSERQYDGSIINPDALYRNWSNEQGNLTLINNTGETLIVSTDKTFRDDYGVDFYKFSSFSFRLDMRDYGGSLDLVRFYAVTLSDLEYARAHGGFQQGMVRESISFIPTEGGTWNPYSELSSSKQKDTGVLVINNYSSNIIKVVVKDINNQPEGQVNRGETNVRLRVPADGLYPLYILDAETLELVKMVEIAIAKNSVEYINVGEKYTPLYQAKVEIFNNSDLHFNAYNHYTRAPMSNENCNGCSTVIKGQSGSFVVDAAVDVQIMLESTSGNIFLQTDVMNLAQGATRKWIIQRNADGNLELVAYQNGSNSGLFSYQKQQSLSGNWYQFNANNVDAAYYYWDFGDGDYSFQQNPVHQFRQAGVYRVELSISDSRGNASTAYMNILVP